MALNVQITNAESRKPLENKAFHTLEAMVSASRWDSVQWAHEEAIAELRAGAQHPQRDAILEWARLAAEHDAAWQNLTDAERDIALAQSREDVEKPPTTPAIERYLQIEDELDLLYSGRLHAGELLKIRRALAELRDWLDGR